MRLLSVIHGPTWGGAHNQAATLAAPLGALGVETTVLLPEEAGAAAARLEAAGVTARTIPLDRLRARADPRLNLRLAARARGQVHAIGGLIDALAIDVVQVHGPTNPQAALATRGRPGTAVTWQLLDSRTPAPLVRASMPYVCRRADSITTWGEALADLHPPARELGERCITVFPPVAAERFEPDDEARAQARRRLGLEPGDIAIGAVGVLTPQKGHEHLIAALGSIGTGRVAARVIGAPSDAHPGYAEDLAIAAGRLESETGGRVEIRFVDPGEDVPLLIRGLDLFAMSSVQRSEGMPTAILEAMCAGLPVVATDVGAVAELVADGETGLLVAAADRAAMASAIVGLRDDPELRRRLGEAGRSRARGCFGLERLAAIHHGAYELALEHRRSG